MSEYGRSVNGTLLQAYNKWICKEDDGPYKEGHMYYFHEDGGMYGSDKWVLVVDEEDTPIKVLTRTQVDE